MKATTQKPVSHCNFGSEFFHPVAPVPVTPPNTPVAPTEGSAVTPKTCG